MAGIILEMYRFNSQSEVRSEFWLLPYPFAPELQKLTKTEARSYIRENQLHVADEDNTGRIWDTATKLFQFKNSATEKFCKVPGEKEEPAAKKARENARKSYKLALMYHLDWICGEYDPEDELAYDMDAVAHAVWDQLQGDATWDKYDKVDDYTWESNIDLEVDGLKFQGWGQEVGEDKEIRELECTLPDGRIITII